MTKAGDSIDNPVTGERIIVLQSGQETAGELFAFELSMSPHGFVSAEHIHPMQEEAFEVTRGTIRFRINGQEVDAATGQKVVIPPGTRHIQDIGEMTVRGEQTGDKKVQDLPNRTTYASL